MIEVDSIRTFDLESQRSVEQLENITIYPAGRWYSADQAAGIREGWKKEEKTYEKALKGAA